MANRQTFLVDTSVLNRGSVPAVQERLRGAIETDVLATCAIVDLEVLFSARNLKAYEAVRMELAGLLPTPVSEAVCSRALEVQLELAKQGHHRLAIPDLLIAAAAELGGRTVLHYDADFERISRVTGQPHEWVARRGSI
ncbi:MAG: PIN domain nuclease [Actinomycetota bacterium]